MLRKLMLVLACIALTLAVTLGVWRWAYDDALEQLETRGEASLRLAIDRALGQLSRYRQLPGNLALHPLTLEALQNPAALDTVEATDQLFQNIADRTGAADIYLMTTDGTTIAASNLSPSRIVKGQNYGFRPYFKRAMTGALGFYHAVEPTSRQRGFFFANPVWDASGEIAGVVVVRAGLERLEDGLRSATEIIYFRDPNGVTFLSNRDALIWLVDDPDSQAVESLQRSAQYFLADLQPFPDRQRVARFGRAIWRGLELPYIPPNVIVLSQPVAQIGMDAVILVDLQSVERQALLPAVLAAVVLALFWLGTLVLLQRRAALAQRLALEEAANTELERRVGRRTRELQTANTDLRREVREREQAEEALRRTQDSLVQAGKLSALGQMSAGISHELNQPLAAIQSYAENAEILIKRGRFEETRSNFAQIAAMAERMGRIIRNLRAFSRKEGERVEAVSLVDVVEDALELIAHRLRSDDIDVQWARPVDAVAVFGGRVRLQQVVMNLLSNAADATAQSDIRRIEVRVEVLGDTARLSVRDHGPGLVTPEKIFEPFYTTKEVGEGMGLGLSISYGIVQSFGGDIQGANHSDGGAVFTVNLARAQAARVA